jgi:hypothetical protein
VIEFLSSLLNIFSFLRERTVSRIFFDNQEKNYNYFSIYNQISTLFDEIISIISLFTTLMENNKNLKLLTLISYCCVFATLLIVILFHIFREDYNPIIQTMSEFTLGSFGFLFPIALFVLGLSSLISCYTLLRSLPGTRISKRIIRYFSLWTTFIIITGIFPTDPFSGPYTFPGAIHAIASFLAFLSLLFCIFYITMFFKKSVKSRFDYMRFYIYFFLCIPGLIIFLIIPLEYKGLTQRVFLGIMIIAYVDIITIPSRNIISKKE